MIDGINRIKDRSRHQRSEKTGELTIESNTYNGKRTKQTKLEKSVSLIIESINGGVELPRRLRNERNDYNTNDI